MSGLTVCAFVSLVISLINISNGQKTQCQNTQANGYYGFCTSTNCCNGMTVSNLCSAGVCCYGQNSCQNQNRGNTNTCPTTYSRDSWKALPQRNPLKDLAPVSHVFVHHTTDGGVCYDNDECSQRVRQFQSYHQLTKKWDDIAWNFLIGGDGLIYEGIGWKKQGFHTLNWNNRSLGIAFIGNFNNQIDDNVMNAMLDSLEDIINCGLSIGQINSDYQLHGHRDVKQVPTSCPGDYLYEQLQEQFESFVPGPF